MGLVGIEPNDLTVMSGWLLTNELQALVWRHSIQTTTIKGKSPYFAYTNKIITQFKAWVNLSKTQHTLQQTNSMLLVFKSTAWTAKQ